MATLTPMAYFPRSIGHRKAILACRDEHDRRLCALIVVIRLAVPPFPHTHGDLRPGVSREATAQLA
jgi:hypothetical protein